MLSDRSAQLIAHLNRLTLQSEMDCSILRPRFDSLVLTTDHLIPVTEIAHDLVLDGTRTTRVMKEAVMEQLESESTDRDIHP